MKLSPFYFLLCALFILLGISPSWAEDVTAEQLIRNADQFRKYTESFQFTLEVTSVHPNRKARSNRMTVSVKDQASLVKFEAPSHIKGQAMLFKDRDLWFHTPRTKRLVRILPSEQLLGDASNGDVTGIRFGRDYIPSIIGKENVDGMPTYILDLRAKDRKVTYARIKYWITQDGHRPVKSEHYTVSGRLLKIVQYEQFIETNDGFKLGQLTIENALRKGQKTIMTYSSWNDVALTGAMFQKNFLKNIK